MFTIAIKSKTLHQITINIELVYKESSAETAIRFTRQNSLTSEETNIIIKIYKITSHVIKITR